jgi:phospholipase A1
MKYAVFLPGIMGSFLSTPGGEEVWPPTATEVLFGYKRKKKLLQDDLVVGDIIREASCFDIYQPLIDTFTAMGFKESGAGDRLLVAPYDWRRDLETLADAFAARLDGLPAAATSITIVAHSMGGLIARLVLETGKFDSKPWFPKIKAFIALAVPHLGSPLALARVLGLDTAMGISAADFREIAADPRYPSGYQLMPAPREAACWDIKAGSTLGELDYYQPSVASQLGMVPALVARTAWLHASFAAGKPPAHVRYFYFAGTGHETATRVNVGASAKQVTFANESGDGAVPMWSALPRSAQKQLVIGEHARFFRETPFKAVFFRLFGKNFPTPPVEVAGTVTASLSVQAITLPKKREIEILIVPARPVESLKGKLQLMRSEGPGKPFVAFGAAHPVSYAGPAIPLLKLRLPPTGTPGFYQAKFTGKPKVSQPVQFAITDK